MKPVTQKCAIAFALSFFATAAVAFGGPAPLKVFVDRTGDDSVGNAFVYQLKEALHKSSLYPLADAENSAALILDITTLDSDRNKGNQSVVAWALVAPKGVDLYLKSGVMMVAKNGVAEPVATLVAAIDRAVAGRRSDVPASNEWTEFEAKWKTDVAAATATLPPKLQQTYMERMSVQLALFRIGGVHADTESLTKAVAVDFQNSFEGGSAPAPSDDLQACRAELAKLKPSAAPKPTRAPKKKPAAVPGKK